MDPRVNVVSAGIEQQFKLETRLASELTTSTEAVTRANSVLDQLHKIAAQPSGALADSIKAFDQKVGTMLRGTTPPVPGAALEVTLTRANGAVGMLYESIGQADAAPTAAQINAVADTERDLSDVMKQWEQIKQSDLAALNRQLKSANLPEIHPESEVQSNEVQTDVE